MILCARGVMDGEGQSAHGHPTPRSAPLRGCQPGLGVVDEMQEPVVDAMERRLGGSSAPGA